jgi:hypothetical protein
VCEVLHKHSSFRIRRIYERTMFVCRIKTKYGISVDDNRNIICVKLQFIWTCLLRTEDFYLNFHQSKTGTEHDAHIFVGYEMRNVCGGPVVILDSNLP